MLYDPSDLFLNPDPDENSVAGPENPDPDENPVAAENPDAGSNPDAGPENPCSEKSDMRDLFLCIGTNRPPFKELSDAIKKNPDFRRKARVVEMCKYFIWLASQNPGTQKTGRTTDRIYTWSNRKLPKSKINDILDKVTVFKDIKNVKPFKDPQPFINLACTYQDAIEAPPPTPNPGVKKKRKVRSKKKS